LWHESPDLLVGSLADSCLIQVTSCELVCLVQESHIANDSCVGSVKLELPQVDKAQVIFRDFL
jgi:hypothetical protein